MISKKKLHLALSKEVMSTAIKIALIVGSILAMINHGTEIIDGTITIGGVYQVLITYLFPYCVSTFSSLKMIERVHCIECAKNNKADKSNAGTPH